MDFLCDILKFILDVFTTVVEVVAEAIAVVGEVAIDLLSDLAEGLGDALGLDGSAILVIAIGALLLWVFAGDKSDPSNNSNTRTTKVPADEPEVIDV